LLRSSSEQPGYDKSIRETTKLSLGEPDPAIFQPPKGYAVKTVEMDEVPCIEAQDQHSSVALAGDLSICLDRSTGKQ
jgi:hypothetical protein